ncbi:MAG: alcohol dehydrogenase catalytic domain-containing protein [bacterium]|nr:alcohol dehydrogenase catalytic domain-containing protein [bacterium]
MAKMRSAVLVGPRDIRLEEVERPTLDDDTVIIKIESLGICGSNLHWWTGAPVEQGLMRFPLPGGGGHEYAGVVEEVGAAVARVKPGDRVAVDLFESTSCGACPQCAAGLYGQCEQRRFLGVGGFVEYLKTTDRGLYVLPQGVDVRTAAAIEPCACAVSGVRRGGLRGGETVVVLGAGVLGLSAAAAAKALGAHKVVISAKHDLQASLATRFGADVVLRSGQEDLVERIKAETGGRGADLVIETVGGHAPTLTQALEVLRPGCSIVVLGLWDEPVAVDSWSAVLKDARMIFSLTYGRQGLYHDFELCLRWMASGQLPVEELVTHSFALAEIDEAFRIAADKSQGVVKVIVNP